MKTSLALSLRTTTKVASFSLIVTKYLLFYFSRYSLWTIKINCRRVLGRLSTNVMTLLFIQIHSETNIFLSTKLIWVREKRGFISYSSAWGSDRRFCLKILGKYRPGKEPIRLQDWLPCPLKKKIRIFNMITPDKIWRTCARNVMKMINSYVSLIWQHLQILYCLMRQKSWWCSPCFVSKFRLSVVEFSNGFVSRTISIEIMVSYVWSRLLNPDLMVDKT